MPLELTDNGASSASSGSVSSGTASEALIKAASAASSADSAPAASAGDTQDQGGASTSTAAADPTVQPGPEGSAVATATRGEAPPNRIESAVRNARAAVEAKYAAFQGIDPQYVPDMRVGYDLLAELRADPKAFAAKLNQELGISAPAAAPVKEEKPWTLPDPELRSEDGKGAYSADQMRAILVETVKELRAELTGQIKPIQDRYQTEEQSRQEQNIRTQASRQATWALTEARKLPHFTEQNEPLILEELHAIDPAVKKAVGGVAALHMAYNSFLSKHIFPTINSTAEQRVRDSNAKKAATTRGSAHPSDQGGEGGKPALRNVSDLAAHMARLEANATT